MLTKKLAVAPMMEYTDRHDRYFLRLISKQIWLYTEMITCQALLHGNNPARWLRFHRNEHPIALQLGGSNAKDLATCSQMAEQAGYDEVNLNIGCPSDRVKLGRFGASLMAEPQLVAACIKLMQARITVPVTVKCRIGIDDQNEYEHLPNFIGVLADAGCKEFIIHARKAWLKGLSPKDNRIVPPLNYTLVHEIKKKFPDLIISINGGITNLEAVKMHLQHVDGVMVGRAAYHNPYMLALVDRDIFGVSGAIQTRKQIVSQYIPYIDQQLADGVKLTQISRHLLGLFQGLPGARLWRRHISENAHKPEATSQLIVEAADFVKE